MDQRQWAAAIAALTYKGHGWGDFHDAVVEIAGSSFPLLFIPLRNRRMEHARPSPAIPRSLGTIVLAAIVFALFVASLGRGLTS